MVLGVVGAVDGGVVPVATGVVAAVVAAGVALGGASGASPGSLSVTTLSSMGASLACFCRTSESVCHDATPPDQKGLAD